MSQTPDLGTTLIVKTTTDWLEEPFNFWVGNSDTIDDFAGCALAGGLYRNGALVIDMSTESGNGYAVIQQPNRVNIAVPQAVIAATGPGTYQLAVTLITATESIQELIMAAVRIEKP